MHALNTVLVLFITTSCIFLSNGSTRIRNRHQAVAVAERSQNLIYPSSTCQDGEMLNQCGKWCEPKCEDMYRGVRCTHRCQGPAACQCYYKYLRHPDGRCVPKSECPVLETMEFCSANETMSRCGNACERKCGVSAVVTGIACRKICTEPKCSCKSQFYRNPETNMCVYRNECPVYLRYRN